jgi:hypothetical protein
MTMLIKTTKDAHRNGSPGTTVFVYGYGPTKNPFFKEAQTVKANSEGCLLILNAPVSRGQKLLLMNGTEQNPVEAEIRMTRSLGAQTYEVEVSFPVARTDSWPPLHANSLGK